MVASKKIGQRAKGKKESEKWVISYWLSVIREWGKAKRVASCGLRVKDIGQSG